MRSVKWMVAGLAMALAMPAVAAPGNGKGGVPDCSQIQTASIEQVLGLQSGTLAGITLPSMPGQVNQLIQAKSEDIAGVMLHNINQVARAAGISTPDAMAQFLSGCGVGSH
ncbi:MAG: hypothetical protein ACM3JG_09045 [Thiohalocapsa sp.]